MKQIDLIWNYSCTSYKIMLLSNTCIEIIWKQIFFEKYAKTGISLLWHFITNV